MYPRRLFEDGSNLPAAPVHFRTSRKTVAENVLARMERRAQVISGAAVDTTNGNDRNISILRNSFPTAHSTVRGIKSGTDKNDFNRIIEKRNYTVASPINTDRYVIDSCNRVVDDRINDLNVSGNVCGAYYNGVNGNLDDDEATESPYFNNRSNEMLATKNHQANMERNRGNPVANMERNRGNNSVANMERNRGNPVANMEGNRGNSVANMEGNRGNSVGQPLMRSELMNSSSIVDNNRSYVNARRNYYSNAIKSHNVAFTRPSTSTTSNDDSVRVRQDTSTEDVVGNSNYTTIRRRPQIQTERDSLFVRRSNADDPVDVRQHDSSNMYHRLSRSKSDAASVRQRCNSARVDVNRNSLTGIKTDGDDDNNVKYYLSRSKWDAYSVSSNNNGPMDAAARRNDFAVLRNNNNNNNNNDRIATSSHHQPSRSSVRLDAAVAGQNDRYLIMNNVTLRPPVSESLDASSVCSRSSSIGGGVDVRRNDSIVKRINLNVSGNVSGAYYNCVNGNLDDEATESPYFNNRSNEMLATKNHLANMERNRGNNSVANMERNRGNPVANMERNRGNSVANMERNRGNSVANMERNRGNPVANMERNRGNSVANMERNRGNNSVANMERNRGNNSVANMERNRGNPVANMERNRGNPIANMERNRGNPIANMERNRGNPVANMERNRGNPVARPLMRSESMNLSSILDNNNNNETLPRQRIRSELNYTRRRTLLNNEDNDIIAAKRNDLNNAAGNSGDTYLPPPSGRCGSIITPSHKRNNYDSATTTELKYSTVLRNDQQRQTSEETVDEDLHRIINTQFIPPSPAKRLRLNIGCNRTLNSDERSSENWINFSPRIVSTSSRHSNIETDLPAAVVVQKNREMASFSSHGSERSSNVVVRTGDDRLNEHNVVVNDIRQMNNDFARRREEIPSYVQRKEVITPAYTTSTSVRRYGQTNIDNSERVIKSSSNLVQRVPTFVNSDKMILEQEKAKRVQQYVNTLRGMPGSCYETSSPEFRVPLIPTAIRRIA